MANPKSRDMYLSIPSAIGCAAILVLPVVFYPLCSSKRPRVTLTEAAMLRRTLLAAPCARPGSARPLHTVAPGRRPSCPSSASPSTRSHQSQPQQRDAIESLALDADILAPPRTPSSATSPVSTSGSNSANPKTRRQPPDAWRQPPPVLKHNPYASTYSISERDLEEETTGLKDAKKESSRRPPSPKSLPHTTTGVGRRKAQLTATKRQSSTPSRRKDNVSKGPPESLIKQPIRTLTLSPTETIDVRAGGLTLRREGKVRVLGYARLRDACPVPVASILRHDKSSEPADKPTTRPTPCNGTITRQAPTV